VSTQDLGSEGIGLGVADINFQRLETVRAAMPISNHRRFVFFYVECTQERRLTLLS
jgi:hypothetical protein